MKTRCPFAHCSSALSKAPQERPIIRNGFYFRKSDSRRLPRYFCQNCHRSFSSSFWSPLRYQKKRRIHFPLFQLYCSGISQRRLARYLGVNRKTVVRKIRLLAKIEEARQKKFVDQVYRRKPLTQIQFDDLETAEQTKCKPLSVTLAVDPETRKILKFEVSPMPAKGHLSRISLRKYGWRRDERPEGWDQFMRELKPYVTSHCTWSSDENPHYPFYLKKHHPHALHWTTKGGRGSISGQGELKKLRFDPLFSLNHTCAMLRANMNRLFRRSWCLSKTKQGLIDHLRLYVSYHNRYLTPPPTRLGAS